MKRNFCIKTAAFAVLAVFAAPANAYGVVWWHGDEFGGTLQARQIDDRTDKYLGIGVIFNLRDKSQAARWARAQCEKSNNAQLYGSLGADGDLTSLYSPFARCEYVFFEKNCIAVGRIPARLLNTGYTQQARPELNGDYYAFHEVRSMGDHSRESDVIINYFRRVAGDHGPDGARYGPPAEAYARKSFLDTCLGIRPKKECIAMRIRAGCDTDNSGRHHYGVKQTYDDFLRRVQRGRGETTN